jgi:hypothetical protein
MKRVRDKVDKKKYDTVCVLLYIQIYKWTQLINQACLTSPCDIINYF